MIKEKVAKSIQNQVNNELYAAYLYLSMSSAADAAGFRGAGRWFKAHSQEEAGHAMKFFAYLQSQGVQPLLKAVKEPPARFDSLKAMFKGALEHEQFVTGCIDKMVALARSEKDYATEIFLQWYVTEQVEEEEQVQEILDQLEMVGDSKQALFMIDRQLGAREG